MFIDSNRICFHLRVVLANAGARVAPRWRSASSGPEISPNWSVRLMAADLIRGAYLDPLTSAGANSSGTRIFQRLAAVAARECKVTGSTQDSGTENQQSPTRGTLVQETLTS